MTEFLPWLKRGASFLRHCEWVKKEDVRENKLLNLTRNDFKEYHRLFGMSDEELSNSHANQILIEFIQEVKKAGDEDNKRLQRIQLEEMRQAVEYLVPYVDTPHGRVYVKED